VYRKIRGAIEVATLLADGVLKPGNDLDALLESTTAKLNEIKVSSLGDEKVYHFGIADNTDPVVSRVLNNVADDLFSTGFQEFDSRNGGFYREGLAVLAGTTSGGKSILANMLLKHIYLNHNVNTIKITLEMSEYQETRRLLSSLTRIPYSKFTKNQLTPGDKQRIEKVRKEFRKHGEDNNCRFSIWSPRSNVNLDKALLLVKPYGYKVIVIDYITLLDEKPKNREAQWEILSDIARRCKIYSRNTKTLIILLAQLDEESNNIRYSRAIKEHADFVWSWSYVKKETVDSRIIQMKCLKARDMETFSFNVAERFDIMTIENIGDGGQASDDTYNIDKKPVDGSHPEHTGDNDELNLDEGADIDYDQNGMY
jgi:replicative DNA helicase